MRHFIKLTDSVQKIGKMKDSVIIGLLGGLIGTLAMDVSNILLYKAKKTEATYGHLAGQLFVAPFRTKQRKNFILGQLMHLASGSVFGIPLLYILKKTGKDHYLTKGFVSAIFNWGILYTGGQKIGLFKKLRLTKTHYSAAWNNIVYGLVSAKAMVLLADPTIFASSNEINQEASRQVETSVNYSDFAGSSSEFDRSQPHHVVY